MIRMIERKECAALFAVMLRQLGHYVRVGNLQPETDGFGRFYGFHNFFFRIRVSSAFHWLVQ